VLVVKETRDGTVMKGELEKMWDHLQQEQHGLKHKDILILTQIADKHLQVLE